MMVQVSYIITGELSLSRFVSESVRIVSEAVRISGLPEPAANYLTEDCTFRFKMMVQVSYIITGELFQNL